MVPQAAITSDGMASSTRPARRMPRCRTSWTISLPSEDGQELLDFPRGDLNPVVGPLLSLDLDEALEGVLAEDPQHQLGVGGDLDRLAERLRELLDPALLALLGGQVVEILLHRLGELIALLDPLEP